VSVPQSFSFDNGNSPTATPYRPLMWVAAATGLGIGADYYLQSATAADLFAWWWAAAAVLLLMAFLAKRSGQFRLAEAALLIAAASIGGAWHDWRWNYAPANDLGRYAREAPQPACVDVQIVDRVKISPPADRSPLRAIPARTMSEVTVRVLGIRDGRLWREAGGLSRLRVAGVLTSVEQGDRVRVFAQLGLPAPPLNPGEYDWSAAERRAGRLSELFCDDPKCVAVTERAGPVRLAAPLAAIRRWCEQQLAMNVDSADAPLVLATLLGDQERLSDSTKDAFMKTGAIHLLVVSGAHVALLAAIAWRVARGAAISRRSQVLFTGAAVIVYSAIVGAQPSVMRAAILTLATIAALVKGRSASAGNLLGAAALAVMAYNPCELFRAGTQFSFLAVSVLILFTRLRWHRAALDPLARLIDEARPWLEKFVRGVGHWLLVMTAASLAVGIAIAPLVAHHFHVVTPASIVLTPLAAPLVAIALGAGVGLVTVGWLLPPLGTLLGAACGGCLHLTEALVLRAQPVPGSYFYLPGPPAWWLWILYGAAGLLVAVPAWRPRWHWQVSGAMLWLSLGYASLGPTRPSPEELRCTFLAMGHGTCAVLELPSGQTILYDAGSLGSPDAATQIIASYLWHRRIDRIDAVVLSHADIDHYNAMPGLVERFPIGVVYISPMMFDPIATDGQLNAPNYLRDVLNQNGVRMREIWMNDELRTDDPNVAITVLHPPREGVIGRDNANSLLLAVEFAGKRILLPGDLESPGIDLVMADPPLDCDILLAPHHGSDLSDPPGFAAWSRPEWVVMSGRRPDRTLLAHRSYHEAGAIIGHTAANGAITFRITASGIEEVAFRETPQEYAGLPVAGAR
jgi:competence protein ComEC